MTVYNLKITSGEADTLRRARAAAARQGAPHLRQSTVWYKGNSCADGQCLACTSKAQAAREIKRGIVSELPCRGDPIPRLIGLTLRVEWQPTPAQQAMLEAVRAISKQQRQL